MNVKLTHKSGYHAIIENDRGHQVAIDNKAVIQTRVVVKIVVY